MVASLKRLKQKPVFRIVALVGLASTVVALVVFGWTVWTLNKRYAARIYTHGQEAAMPAKPVAIVFGAGYWPSGQISLILRERLDAAIELYRSGQVEKLLFSGTNHIIEYNEPAKMLEYALDQGVPREDIVLDYAGRRTYDTCYRARDIFQLTSATLVTQEYHLPRAIETCDALGIEVVGYSANLYEHKGYYLIRYRLREIPALWRAWWDIYVGHPRPILGEPLPIF